MPNGYNGKILHVDLTAGNLKIEEPDDAFYRKYLGGSAMGAYYLLKHTSPNADALGPENTLSLMTGVVTGAPFSGQSRMTATSKSPLTDLAGDAQCGGFWPAELKFSGFDGIVIHGKSDKPVYLWIHDGEVELRDAAHLMGKFTADVEDTLFEELGDTRVQVLQTGPAGENGVRFSAIISNANRANGRTGMGLVMASKNIKAIAVRGTKKLDVADPDGVKSIAKWGATNFEDSDVFGMGKHGTAGVVTYQDAAGGLPTRNWESGTMEEAESISGTTMSSTILKKRDTCYACVVRCKRVVEVSEGPFTSEARYGGPEYETVGTFGSYCGISNLAAIAGANQLCNMYGMDTISCGATIAWAMDCFEQGLITTEDTGGIELRFGDAEAMVKMVELIGKSEGFGRVLGQGSFRAAEELGVGQDLVVTNKKQELPAHMPQVKPSLALIYSVNPFGADHESSEHDGAYAGYTERMAEIGLKDADAADALNDEKVRYALTTQYIYSCMDSISVCVFVFGPAWHLYGSEQLAEATRAVTGWDISLPELMTVGERRVNLLRAFNAREGVGADADTLPKKLTVPLKGGKSDGVAVSAEEFERAKATYYRMAGWDEDGKPTRSKLEELALAWVADDLKL